MSDPKRYTDLQVWEALHFGGSTNGWIRWEDYARLKAEVDRMTKHDDDTCPHLVLASLLEAENARLKAEVERLRKAGDALCESPYLWENDPAVIAWRAAKEGKPSA